MYNIRTHQKDQVSGKVSHSSIQHIVIGWSLLILFFAFMTSLHIGAGHVTQTIFYEADDFFHVMGDYIIDWNKDLLQFSVTRKSSADPVFSSPPQQAFVAVGVGPQIPVQTFSPGHYKIRTRVRCLTTIQTIDSINLKADMITISGSLSRSSAGLSQFGGLLGLIYQDYDDINSCEVQYEFALSHKSNQSLEFELLWRDVGIKSFHRRCHGKYNRVFLRFATHQEEMFYGLGMQYTSFMHNGRRVPVISQEQGVGRGLQPVTGILNRMFKGEGGSPYTTYSAIPHIVSNYNRSLLIYENLISIFDFTAVPTPQLPPACPSCRKDKVPRVCQIQSGSNGRSGGGSNYNKSYNSNSQVEESNTEVKVFSSRCGHECKKQSTPDMEGLARFLAAYNISVEDPSIKSEIMGNLQALMNMDISMDQIIDYDEIENAANEDNLQCSIDDPGQDLATHRALIELNSKGILESLGLVYGNSFDLCDQGDCDTFEDVDECDGDLFTGWEEGQDVGVSTLDTIDIPQVQIQICADGKSKKVAGLLIQSNSLIGAIEEYTLYSGRMKPLPEWTYKNGSIIAMTGGTEKVMQQYQQLRNASVPISAIWLQDWPGLRMNLFGERLWWNWQLNQQHYPEWHKLVQQMQADDVKILLYANPYLANVAIYPVQVKQPRKKSHSSIQSSPANVTLVASSYPPRKWVSLFRLQRPRVSLNADPSYDSTLFQEALENGYLIRSRRGNMPYIQYSGTRDFRFGTVDFTNPRAREWMAQVLAKNMIGVGAHGFMSDFGELLPMDAQLHSGEAAYIVHNKFPEYWQIVSKRVLEIAGIQDEGLFFSRSAGMQSPQHAQLFWLGDQITTWDEYDGLKSVLTAHLAAALSGLSLTHSDIGGYAMSDKQGVKFLRNKELLIRWAELNAGVDVVMRTHMGILPTKSWQVWSDEATMKEYGFLVGLHNSLGEYRQELMQYMNQKGWPLVRHPILHYPVNLQVSALRWQYMLGDSVMVCPVLNPGLLSVECFLPEAKEWDPIWLIYDTSDKLYMDTLHKYHNWIQNISTSSGDAWISSPATELCPVIFFKRARSISLNKVLDYLLLKDEFSELCKLSWQDRIVYGI